MPYILDGRPISPDSAFTHNDIQYPANWLRLASEDEKAAIGLIWEADPAPYDQRFYWGYDQDGALIPKDHAQLLEQWINTTKATAGTLMQPTDWMVTRSAEPEGKPVPQAVLDRRSEIRAFSDAKEEALLATTTTEELASYVTSADYSRWEPISEPDAEEALEATEPEEGDPDAAA